MMIDNPCFFCGNTKSSTDAIQENGYCGKKCELCNLIYISPRPSLEQITNLYGHDQAHLPAHSHIAQEYPKKLHALHTLGIIKKYISDGDLLELGSGAGYFLIQAQLQGFTPHGIELNPLQSAFIQDTLHIPCQATPLNQDSFGTKKFDIIYHSDVLSHFYEPLQAMKAMHDKLKPNGYLVFETGNIADIDPDYYASFNAMQYPDHLFFFGRSSIERLLEISGFELKEYYSYCILPQLRIMKLVKKLKNIISCQAYATKTQVAHQAHKAPAQQWKMLAKTGYHSLMHVLRYRIGAYLPQARKPQTVIVVAQKRA